MKRNSLDTHLLSIAQGMIESGFNIYIHHQPKHNNRRWGIRRHDFQLSLLLGYHLNRIVMSLTSSSQETFEGSTYS